MNSIAIITIVVVVLLTGIIFGLVWLAYSSLLRAYKMEVNQGEHDEEILKEYHGKKAKRGLIGAILSYVALSLLAGLFITGIVYKARGENFAVKNQVALVIKSESMSDYYDDEYKIDCESNLYDSSLQFDIGDICVFNKMNENDELVKGKVYGYKYKDIIVTHRLVGIKDGLYEFRGDNNSISDPYFVTRESIVYQYTGKKVPGIGAIVLYAQSYFGIWSLIGIIGITVCSEIIFKKMDKINRERDKLIYTKPEGESSMKTGEEGGFKDEK